MDALKTEMDALNRRRKMYEEFGLIPKEVDDSIIKSIPEKSTHEMLIMLGIYVEDYKKRLQRVEKLFDKIVLFLTIINDEHKFTDKSLIIQAPNGKGQDIAFFKATNNQIIKLRQLSSGEKNDFILFYEMIFKTNSSTLLLMDEPEISTHIAWQMLFSREVDEICKRTGMQALIATHSPNIVRGYLDHTILMGEV